MQQHNSMPMSTLGTEHQAGVTAADVSGSFAQAVAFMREEREHLHQMMEKQKAEVERLLERDAEAKAAAKAEREQYQAAAKAEREAMSREMEKLREAKLQQEVGLVHSKLHEQQTAALQSRLEALHAAKLLSDDELYRLEDLIADSFEEETRASGVGVCEQLTSMITLSERIASDSALARQIRRKFM